MEGTTACGKASCPIRGDFLPLRCPRCGALFCQSHFRPESHECSSAGPAGSAVSSPSSPEPLQNETLASIASQAPSEVFRGVSDRFEGLEGEVSGGPGHYRVAGREKEEAAERRRKADSDRLVQSRRAIENARSDAGRRVGSQVHRMLCKSKAEGDPAVHPDDKFYLEVRYCSSDPVVQQHWFYFRSSWTVGRALDDICGRDRASLPAGWEQQGLDLVCGRTGLAVDLSATLLSCSLEPYDVVIIALKGAATAAETRHQQPQQGEETVVDASAEVAEPSAAVPVLEMGEGPLSFRVAHGKDRVYEVRGVDPGGTSVLDLKLRLEEVTGVPALRIRLVFKGLWKDDAMLLSGTKVQPGSKVMMMGTTGS
jgi:hypothetical protein